MSTFILLILAAYLPLILAGNRPFLVSKTTSELTWTSQYCSSEAFIEEKGSLNRVCLLPQEGNCSYWTKFDSDFFHNSTSEFRMVCIRLANNIKRSKSIHEWTLV